MINNSERNYFDFATDATAKMNELIFKCRHWKDLQLGCRPTMKQFLADLVEIESDPALARSNGIDYLIDLMKDIYAECIENDKVTLVELNKLFKDTVPEDKTLLGANKLHTFSKSVIDTKRIMKNHEIISKRFDIKSLLKKEYFGTQRQKYGFLLPFTFSMCRKLDTYNLEIPEKINLMCEEIAFIVDHEYKFALSDTDANVNRMLALGTIIPSVFTYIMGTYSAEGIPEDTIKKVMRAAIDKINASSFLCRNDLVAYGSRYLSIVEGTDTKHVENKELFQVLVPLQMDGGINSHKGLIKIIKYMTEYNTSSLQHFLWYTVYFYAIFNNKFKEHNISLYKALLSIIDAKIGYCQDEDEIINTLNTIKDELTEFIDCLCPVEHFVTSEDEMYKRYTESLYRLRLAVDMINGKIWYYKTRKKEQSEIHADRYDDTGIPNQLSTYEIKNLVTFDFIKDKVDHLGVKESNDFIDIITDRSIIINQEATDYISKVLDIMPEYFDLKYLKSRLESSYKEISESSDYQDYTKSIIGMGNINSLISKINKINTTPDIIKEDTNIMDCAMDNINCTIDDIVKNNINQFIIAETTKEVIKLSPVHELGIMNYARLALDKLKHGWDKLNDTQKEIFNTIDQMAETFDHFNEKEAKAEARLQVVKGRMLPSASSCLKTILQAGALFIINPWFGLVLIIVKYVTSKNATKEERQAVVDELEVEIEMIDRRIQDAVDEKDYKQERKLRVLKKKMLTQYSKLSYDNQMKWDNNLTMKSQTDETGSRIGLKD